MSSPSQIIPFSESLPTLMKLKCVMHLGPELRYTNLVSQSVSSFHFQSIFLSDGIHVDRRLFRGILELFLADTVAAHQIGGFKVGVELAFRKCRHCMATGDQMQTKASTFFSWLN